MMLRFCVCAGAAQQDEDAMRFASALQSGAPRHTLSLVRRNRNGRLAQLVRAPALQAGCRGFESLTAHQRIHGLRWDCSVSRANWVQ
jgi:hypothetical protein